MNPQQVAQMRMAQSQSPTPRPPTPIIPAINNPAVTTPTQQAPTISNPQVNIPEISNRPQPAPVAMATNQMGGQQQGEPPQGSVDYSKLKKEGYSPTQIEGYLSSNPGIQLENAPSDWASGIAQNTIIPGKAPITETFGEVQPGVEVFSGGITTGTGIGVKTGTPLATPPGQWKVVSAFDGAKQKGYIGDSDGEGWGNNIVVQNVETGEELRYSHLSQVEVAEGDTINGNRVIGLSGQSGNVTGPHLNLQYMTPDGQPADVLKSAYAEYLPISE